MVPGRSVRGVPELPALKRLAEQLASERSESPTTVHLLAAVALSPGAAADLLTERKLCAEALLAAAGPGLQDIEQGVQRSLLRARELAGRMGTQQATAAHLLSALLSEPRCAAARALKHCGTDVGRLRAAALNLGLGLIGRRRVPAQPNRGKDAERAAGIELNGAQRPALKVVNAPARTASVVPLRPQQKAPAPEPAPFRAPAPVLDTDRFGLDPHQYPTLASLGHNLTLAAFRGELDPTFGRDAEIEQTLDVLAKRQGNNPCLVGPAGVGKTSVVRGLAKYIAESGSAAGTFNACDERIIVEICISQLLTGTAARGALAHRFSMLKREVGASGGRVVLFFDEIHQLFTAEGSEEIASELKLALSRGELPCIGATTSEEYKRTIDADAALARRFTLVEVEEPSREDAFLILAALAPKLGEHHGVRYSEPALALSVAWSLRYLPGRALPDKTVSILDLAGARARRRGAASVESEAVAEVVAELSGVPIERLLETDVERMLRLEQILEDRVVGHTEQIGRIARILRRNAAGLGSRRPIGTFLLLGPTGVGKTETAKAIAEALFHSDSSMTRLDMSEYAEPHAVARLIGSPPGYVGHEAGGQLSEAVRRRPYQVILLDEIEKAHPEVLTAFLAVFDEGRLTDGRGRTVDFTNTVIVMTSNIGVQQAGGLEHRRVGFGNLDRAASANQLEQHFVAQARKTLSPELYNRIDEVLAFAPLDSSALAEVAQRLLMGVAEQLRERHGVHMDIDPETVAYLFEHGGFEPSLGARPLRRAIARLIEAGLAEKILQGELRAGDTARVRVDSGTLRIESSGPNG